MLLLQKQEAGETTETVDGTQTVQENFKRVHKERDSTSQGSTPSTGNDQKPK
jgi:hypothetical protein